MTTRPHARPDPGPHTLEAARAGNRQAFDDLVSPHRDELRAHCYRMLGSMHDADDALQNALLRAWKGLPGFAGRSTIRTWLYKITTNACLALIDRNRQRHLPVDITDPPRAADSDPAWLEPFVGPHDPGRHDPESPTAVVERGESVELAFVAAFQYLPANQRAVLLLRDVLGFSAAETAELLDATVPAVTSSLQRARRTVRQRLPDRTQQETLRALGDRKVQALVARYVDAWQRNDADALLALLADDATFSMPPLPSWYRGRADIEGFLLEQPLTCQWRVIPTRASGQLAFACYIREDSGWIAHSLDILTVRDDRIEQITGFLQPDLISLLGLPDHL